MSRRGSDGATGATAVRRCAGLVITATNDGSTHADMPRATDQRDHITDHVRDPGDIAALLLSVVSGARLG